MSLLWGKWRQKQRCTWYMWPFLQQQLANANAFPPPLLFVVVLKAPQRRGYLFLTAFSAQTSQSSAERVATWLIGGLTYRSIQSRKPYLPSSTFPKEGCCFCIIFLRHKHVDKSFFILDNNGRKQQIVYVAKLPAPQKVLTNKMKCLISLVQRRIRGHFGESRDARIQQIKHSHRSNAERMTEDAAPLLIHYHTLWSKVPIKHHSPAPQGWPSVRYKPWMPLRGEYLIKFIILVFRRAKSCTVEYTMTSLVSITAWQVPGRRTASCRRVHAWWTVLR